MGGSIDFICAGVVVAIVRSFKDLSGRTWDSGTTGRIDSVSFDWSREEALISWNVDGRPEQIRLSIFESGGPRSGRMGDYFRKSDQRFPNPNFEEWKQENGAQESRESRGEHPVANSNGYWDSDQYSRARPSRRFEGEPDSDDLEGQAEYATQNALAIDPSAFPTRYRFAKDRAIELWHVWGSTATAGGEGLAMSLRIEGAKRRLTDHGAGADPA